MSKKQPEPTIAKEQTFQPIKLNLIERSKTNPRKYFDETHLNELAESIKKHGVLQAILLRPFPHERSSENGKSGKFEIVAGERRYRAAKLAGLTEIPANVRTLDDKETLEIQVIENLQRTDLSPMEEATGYDELIKKHGYTAEGLAAKVGKSASYIHKRRQLVYLCEDAQRRFSKGEFTLGHALILARINDESLQLKALRCCDGLSLNRLKWFVENNVLTSLKSAPFSITDPNLLPVAGACTACPYNTGAQMSELFDDFKKGANCTKPSCFNKKITAHWQQVSEKAQAKGQEVLSRSESSKIYSGYYTDAGVPKPDSGYVLQTEKCKQHPKQLPWQKLVGDKLTPILAMDKKNQVRKLYRVKDLQKIFKDEKWWKEAPKSKSPDTQQSSRNWEREQNIIARTERKLLEAGKYAMTTNSISMDLCCKVMVESSYTDLDFVKALTGEEVNYTTASEKLLEYLSTLDNVGKVGTLAMLDVVTQDDELQEEFFASIKVDVKAIAAEAKKEIEAEESKAKETKPKEPKAKGKKAVKQESEPAEHEEEEEMEDEE